MKDKRLVLFYGAVVLFAVSVSFVVIFVEPIWRNLGYCHTTSHNAIHYLNPSYVYRACEHTRFLTLLGLTPEECDHGRRLLAAALLGGLIGYERRTVDRPAGIRTMSLISMGSALFHICSTFGYTSGPMATDASRISASIPSGVGFLGAALIFKEHVVHWVKGKAVVSSSATSTPQPQQQHVVHGLITATCVWLSAAVGVACGSGTLYATAVFATGIMIVLLRFAPRQDVDPEEEEEDDGEQVTQQLDNNHTPQPLHTRHTVSFADETTSHHDDNDEESSLLFQKQGSGTLTSSLRSRASLGTAL